LKLGTAKNTKKMRFKTNKNDLSCFYAMEIAIKRDLRPLNAHLINFVRLGEVFYFSLDFEVF
jgi:hypothetical protein